MADHPSRERVTSATGNPLIGPWSLAVLTLISCLVVWTNVERFMDPVSEKYVYTLFPGDADFFFAFGGARALLLGANPYHNDIAGLEDPWHQEYLVINGEQVRGNYPPTHFILYLPFALLTDDFREAGRWLFPINLAALLLLAIISWRLLLRLSTFDGWERRHSALLIPLFFVILCCNVATMLGLERGDGGDIWAAVFCWWAVLLFLNNWYFTAMFLMVPAALTKGYAIWCALGLGLLGLKKGAWVPTVVGGFLGLAVFLLPVLRYIPDAFDIRVALLKATDQVEWMSRWWNHGFRNVFKHLAPSLMEAGWLFMTVYCAVLMSFCWLKARAAERERRMADFALWVVLMVTSAIELMLGANHQSLIYNLVLVMPGLLIVVVGMSAFARGCGLPDRSIGVIGVFNLVTVFCVFKFRLFNMEYFPLPGIGMILFLLTIGGSMAVGKWARQISPVPSVLAERAGS